MDGPADVLELKLTPALVVVRNCSLSISEKVTCFPILVLIQCTIVNVSIQSVPFPNYS